MRIRAFVFLGLLLAPAAAFAQTAPVPDIAQSKIVLDKSALKADGMSSAKVTVSLKDKAGLAMKYQKVSVVSDRGPLDTITPKEAQTFLLGTASFGIASSKPGQATLSILVNGQPFGVTSTVTFTPVLSIGLAVGDLVKIPDDHDAKTLSDTAVYYFANDGKRYVFPNEKVYFTWYGDFSQVKVIPQDQMSLLPIGGNVTYRPGTKLVKFQTDPKTYLVAKGGVLQWVQSETVARDLFGENWNQHVDDISEAFYVNYTFGQPIGSAYDAPLAMMKAKSGSIDQDKGLLK